MLHQEWKEEQIQASCLTETCQCKQGNKLKKIGNVNQQSGHGSQTVEKRRARNDWVEDGCRSTVSE